MKLFGLKSKVVLVKELGLYTLRAYILMKNLPLKNSIPKRAKYYLNISLKPLIVIVDLLIVYKEIVGLYKHLNNFQLISPFHKNKFLL